MATQAGAGGSGGSNSTSAGAKAAEGMAMQAGAGGMSAVKVVPPIEAERVNAMGAPDCSTPGCIRSARFIGNYAKEALTPYLDTRVNIDNGYTVATLEFVTRTRTSLATITVPYPLNPPPGGYHVVANAHGTAGLDDPCALTGSTWGTGLAGLFGARGAIGVSPDYPGPGTPGSLPYLVSEVEGAAALDAIRAAHAVARALAIPISGRSAVVGLSEGGHATLAAAAMHTEYAPDLELRAFGASGPATMWLEFWQRGIALDGEHIAFHAMMFYAWSIYYGYKGASIWLPSVAREIDDIMTKDCSFDFNGTRETYGARLGNKASAIFTSNFLNAYENGTLSQSAPAFANAFAANRVKPFKQTAPLAIWQGEMDTKVPSADTDAVVEALRQGGVTVDYRKVPGADDLDVAFGFVSQHQAATDESLAWVFEQLNR